MSIIYSVIVKLTDKDIVNLTSYDSATGNYPAVTQKILEEVQIKSNITYKYNEQYNYHIEKDGNLLFVCLADSSMKVKTAFAFLEEIRKKFKQKYSNEQIAMAKSFSMSTSFSQIYHKQIDFFNSNKEQDKKEILMRQLGHLNQIMNQNIDKVLQREQKIEITVKKTAKVDTIGDDIKSKSSQIKKQAFLAKHKCKILIGCLLAACAGGLVFVL